MTPFQYRDRTEHVYLLGGSDSRLVKIGRSTNVRARVRGIRMMSPTPVELLWQHEGGADLEKALHGVFRECRKHGEWFDLGDDPVGAVAEAVATLLPTPHDTSPSGSSPVEPAQKPRMPEPSLETGEPGQPVSIRVTRSAALELKAASDKRERRAVQMAIQGLATQPRPANAKPIGRSPGLLRLKVRSNHVLYEVTEDGVLVLEMRLGLLR